VQFCHDAFARKVFITMFGSLSLFPDYLLLGVSLLALLFVFLGLRFIPNNRVGIVEKRFSAKGSLHNGIIALQGEAGFQPNLLRGGVHFLMPFQYRVHSMPLVTIPQGKIGYIFARDGAPLPATQTLARSVDSNQFQNVAAFLLGGGQQGPQQKILREGTYAINVAQFVVLSDNNLYYLPLGREELKMFQSMSRIIDDRDGFEPIVIKGADDILGVVTVHDGASLAQGEIIAPTVGENPSYEEYYHNNFQSPERFLAAGGRRGRQLQVLVEGTYYINRLFATVELVQKTTIEVGNVGVVISYNGLEGADLSGVDYKHGEMVNKGDRGVWSTPLMAGKYAFNTYAGKVSIVPTTNFILKWNRNESGSHRFDENLSEISLITKDAFEPNLPLSVVVHIDYTKAPLVIQRFGDIKKLVDQTLDPMVAAYFKNIAQTRTLIQLLQERSQIQKQASAEMKEKFAHYNLELEEVLIGTPGSSPGDKRIEEILTQLRARQIAEEQIETYAQQERAAFKERQLKEAQAKARQQQVLTESEISITIQANEGRAEYQRSMQQAAQIRTLAEAEAEKTARLGIAQALATEELVRAYGGPKFQVLQMVMNRFSESIEKAHIDVVPKIMIGGQGGQGNIFESLIGLILSEKLEATLGQLESPKNPEAEEMKRQLCAALSQKQPTSA
jgi:uncharacterized membrane protein YqiK